MEAIVEVILQILAEIALQVVAEILFEIGLQGVAETTQRVSRNPFLAVIGYALLGAGVGALSLFVVPHLFIQNPELRKLNLVLAPVVAGAAMVALGAWRRRRGQDLIRLDRFFYGFLFALSMALVRYHWGGW